MQQYMLIQQANKFKANQSKDFWLKHLPDTAVLKMKHEDWNAQNRSQNGYLRR